MRSSVARILCAAALGAVLSLSCGGPSGPAPGVLEPDFTLQDLNPNSATSGMTVSPRQHMGRVSAWYFGHST